MPLRSPATWGVVYLVLIPIFAGIYLTLPRRSFFDSNSNMESNVRESRKQLALAIRSEIRKAFTDSQSMKRMTADPGKVTEPMSEGTHVDVRSISVSRVSFDPGSMHLVIAYNIEKRSNPLSVDRFSIPLSVDPDSGDDSTAMLFGGHYMYDACADSSEQWRHASVVLVPPVGSMDLVGMEEGGTITYDDEYGETHAHSWGSSGNCGVLWASDHLRDLISAQSDAARGFPRDVRGGFGRMLYVSAMTETTVGMGDIVPITPLARALTALQGVLGIIAAGLFLNAVGRLRRPN